MSVPSPEPEPHRGVRPGWPLRVVRAYRTAFSGLPRDVWLLAVVAFVTRSGTMVLPFLSLYVTVELGMPVTSAGIILTVYGLGATLGSYVGGMLSDRIGPVRFQQLSLFGSGFAFLGFAVLRGLPALCAGAFVLSAVAESFRPANMSAIAARAPTTARVRAFSLMRLAIHLGFSVGPAVGGFLALVDYTWLFLADAATCWLAAGVLTLTLSDPRPPATARASGPAADDDGAAVAAPAPERQAPLLRPPSPWRDPPFLLLMLLVSALAVVFFQIFSTLPLTFREVYGFDESSIGILLSLNAALLVLFEMLIAHWAEQRDLMPLIGFGAFLVCLGFGLTGFGPPGAAGSTAGLLFAALTVLVWSFGEMLSLPLVNGAVGARARTGSHGRYMGVFTTFFGAAFVVGPATGTWIYSRFGPAVLWACIALLGPPLWVAIAWLGRWFREPRT